MHQRRGRRDDLLNARHLRDTLHVVPTAAVREHADALATRGRLSEAADLLEQAAEHLTGPDATALVAIVPVSFGFSLMSAIDYRADNFGAVYFAMSLVLLEWNRREPHRGRAVVAGLLAALGEE